MRIAFVNQPRDPMAAADTQSGSVAIITWELARRLAALGHDVTVYAPRAPRQMPAETGPGRVAIRRAPRTFRTLHKALDLAQGIGGVGRQPYFASPLFFREYARGVARELAHDPPEVVHLQTYAQFLPLLRTALPRARLVLHAHDESLVELDHATTLCRLRQADAVVAVSSYLARRLRTRFPDLAARIRAVDNGVDLDRFAPAAAAAAERRPGGGEPGGGGIRLLFVGRVSPEKGVHVLTEAFARLARSDPEVELDIVGPEGLFPFGFVRLLLIDPVVAPIAEFYGHGPLERLRKQILGARTGYRRALVARLPAGCRDRVRFHGPVAHDRLHGFYNRATLFVLPSVCNEPFGVPLVEAMAAGVPTVASRSGGVPDIVAAGTTGLLVERGDPGALAAAIGELLADPARRAAMGVAARQRAERLFGWERAAARLEALYARLLGA